MSRPNTEWEVEHVTELVVFVTRVKKHPAMGCCSSQIPQFLKRNMSIITMQNSYRTGKPFNDNLCMFRALAGFQKPELIKTQSFEREAKKLCLQYCKATGRVETPKDFSGLDLGDLGEFEKIFQINVHGYILTDGTDENILLDQNHEDDDDPDSEDNIVRRAEALDNLNDSTKRHAKLVIRSMGRYKKTMRICIFQNHAMLIHKFNTFANSWKCDKCEKLFDHHGTWKRHCATCKDRVIENYPGK